MDVVADVVAESPGNLVMDLEGVGSQGAVHDPGSRRQVPPACSTLSSLTRTSKL